MNYSGLMTGVVASLSVISINLSYAESASPIIVSASRTAESVDETLASVSVITRRDIEASQAREIVDLLRLEAGIDLSVTGGPGNTANIFLRGANSNHTLFMIDGMRVASSTTGTFALEQLSLDQIERIEIVRGPRASQYGSDAIGGIIHIFTRKNTPAHARVGFGSFNTRETSAGLTVGKDIRLTANASYERSNGFSSTNPGNFSYDADDDGYRKNNLNLNLDVPVNSDMQLNFKGLHINNWSEFDIGTSNTETNDAVASFKHQVSDLWGYTLITGYNEGDVLTSSSNPSLIETNRALIDLQNDIAISDDMLLLVGFSHYEDKARNTNLSSNTNVFDERIDNSAVFTNLSTTFGKHDILLSARYDDHSNFGSHNSGLISWGYTVNPNLRFTSTISNAFRAPTINELYHPGFGGFYAGNANLNPEESDGGEIGATLKVNGNEEYKLTFFRNWVSELIAYQGTNNQAININRARLQGYELSHKWQQDGWMTISHLTVQKAYDESTRADLLRRPRHKFSLIGERQHSKNSSSRLEILYASSRTDFGGVKLPSYTIYNASTRIQLDKHFAFDARIENITNKQYELAADYNTPDRSFYLGLSYQLD